MKIPWPWKKVEQIEEAEKKAEVERLVPAIYLDDDVATEEEVGGEISGEVERVVRKTKESMNDGLDRLKRALVELEAEIHAIKEGGSGNEQKD